MFKRTKGYSMGGAVSKKAKGYKKGGKVKGYKKGGKVK
jgi:hypothetical protein